MLVYLAAITQPRIFICCFFINYRIEVLKKIPFLGDIQPRGEGAPVLEF
jgi:hypothetical protein